MSGFGFMPVLSSRCRPGAVVGWLVIAGWLMGSSAAYAVDITQLVAPNAEMQKLVGDCKFTEGPAYSPQEFLLFSDIPNSRIVRWNPDGVVQDFLKPSGEANGLMFDANGDLYICQGGARRVVKIGKQDGKTEVLADKYDGKPLNSPNDLALDGHGGLYFTDPRYGADLKLDQTCMGVYYISPQGQITRVIDSLERPNGILVSQDGRKLYVAEPNKGQLYLYDITAPGQVSSGKLIFEGDKELDGGGPDGMALDEFGNVYTTYAGIVVLKADGTLIGRIPVPERPANCKFGGPDRKTLFVTARTSLYSLSMSVAGAELADHGPRPEPQVTRISKTLIVQPASFKKDETTEVSIKDITLKVPASWKQEDPSNNLRLSQFKLPPVEGDKEPAELVVSFFGGGGGGVDANLKRWEAQFQPDGRQFKLTRGDCPQGSYVFADIAGTYNQSSGGGPFAPGKVTPKPGFRSLSVVLEIKGKGNYFLRLTGPVKTVTEAAEAFRASFGADASREADYKMGN